MRAFLILVVVTISGMIGWLLYISSPSSVIGLLPSRPMDGKALALDGIHLFKKKNNKIVMELIASRGVISLDESQTDLEKFTLVSHSDKYGIVTITAEEGTMVNATNDIEARGSVLARDGEGRALLTDSITWLNREREIRTDDKVRVFGARFIITGRGMTADVDNERVELLSDVQATFRAPDDE